MFLKQKQGSIKTFYRTISTKRRRRGKAPIKPKLKKVSDLVVHTQNNSSSTSKSLSLEGLQIKSNIQKNVSSIRNILGNDQLQNEVVEKISSRQKQVQEFLLPEWLLNPFQDRERKPGIIVMDTWWYTWNIAMAFVPGLFVLLLTQYYKGEARAFYDNQQKKDRERLMDGKADEQNNIAVTHDDKSFGIFTIWDGIKSILLGQDGIGKAFVDFQKNIKKLLDKGVILCIASKNNYSDVLDVFKKHPEMQINQKDIILFKVNWKEKYLNLLEISKDLNVGLDSIVFWDDNPFERQKMRAELPDVCTIEPNKEVIYWPEQLNKLELFTNFKETNEDKKKLYQYKIRSKFIVERNNAQNELMYLKKIKLKAKKINIQKGNISRASQMTQKTNQFNLSTKRYSTSDIQIINKDKKKKVSLFKISDIYGDHGIVGMFILKEKNKNSIYLDTFLLSCRVFGRYLETWMLNSIKNTYPRNVNIYAEYIPTKKNILVKDFLDNHNFELIKKNKKTSLYKIKSYNIKSEIMKIYD